jgi:hypothetical protein
VLHLLSQEGNDLRRDPVIQLSRVFRLYCCHRRVKSRDLFLQSRYSGILAHWINSHYHRSSLNQHCVQLAPQLFLRSVRHRLDMFNRLTKRLIESSSDLLHLVGALNERQICQATLGQLNGELCLAGIIRNEVQPAALRQGLYRIKPVAWLEWICFRQENQAR